APLRFDRVPAGTGHTPAPLPQRSRAAPPCPCARSLGALLASRPASRHVPLHRRPPAQVDAAHAMDLGDDDHQLVADRDDILHAWNAIVGELADVHQPLLAGQDLDECAEVHDPGHLAEVLLANLDVAGQALDPADRLLRRLARGGGDLDGPVVLDVDLGPRLGGDLPDHLAAGTDHVADLVDRDLHGVDARRVWRQLAAAGADHGGHLVENEEARTPSLLERVTHDLRCDARNLDVH